MPLLLGNFVEALKDESVSNGSLYKQNNSLEKCSPVTAGLYILMTVHTKSHCALLTTPRTGKLKIY